MNYTKSQTAIYCYYCPRTRTIIDAVFGGQDLTLSELASEEEILEQYPGARLMTYGEAFASFEESESVTSEIDAWMYSNELDRFPPRGWTILGHTESFKARQCGRVTPIYCRIGERYFRLLDRPGLTHEQIVQRVVTSYMDAPQI